MKEVSFGMGHNCEDRVGGIAIAAEAHGARIGMPLQRTAHKIRHKPCAPDTPNLQAETAMGSMYSQ